MRKTEKEYKKEIIELKKNLSLSESAYNFSKQLINDFQKKNKKITKRNKSLEKENLFTNEVKNDYILSNKHIRDMERKRLENEYEKSRLKNEAISAIFDIAGQVLPSLLIDLLTQNKKEDVKQK